MPNDIPAPPALDAAARPIAQDVRILHDFAYSIGTADVQVPNQRAAPQDGDPNPLVEDLAMRLYSGYYMRTGNVGQPHRSQDRNLGRRFLNDLSRANLSGGTWIPGVRVLERQEKRVKIQLRTKTAWVENALVEMQGGDTGRLRGTREVIHPAWYYFFGESRPDVSGGRPVRLYWHVSVEGAVPFVRTLTRTFNAHGVPFEAKVLREPQAFQRSDAGVAYVSMDDWAQVREILPEAHAEVAPYMRTKVPLFTKRLGHGLAVAEDPGLAGASFGTHRCHLVAQGLWAAHEAMADDIDGKLGHIRSAFVAAGLDPAAPHLGPGSAKDYHVEPTFKGEWDA